MNRAEFKDKENDENKIKFEGKKENEYDTNDSVLIKKTSDKALLKDNHTSVSNFDFSTLTLTLAIVILTMSKLLNLVTQKIPIIKSLKTKMLPPNFKMTLPSIVEMTLKKS